MHLMFGRQHRYRESPQYDRRQERDHPIDRTTCVFAAAAVSHSLILNHRASPVSPSDPLAASLTRDTVAKTARRTRARRSRRRVIRRPFVPGGYRPPRELITNRPRPTFRRHRSRARLSVANDDAHERANTASRARERETTHRKRAHVDGQPFMSLHESRRVLLLAKVIQARHLELADGIRILLPSTRALALARAYDAARLNISVNARFDRGGD